MVSQYIYVICEESKIPPVKIGFSAEPERRLAQLQIAQSATLVLFHKELVPEDNVRGFERAIHRDLRHCRVRGEWFRIEPAEAVMEIKHALIKYGDIENLLERLRSRTI